MEKGIRDLLIDELHDSLSSEEQIVAALPAMVAAADSKELKEAFASHLKETKGHVVRLGKVFKLLKVEKRKKMCEATKGLVQECKDAIKGYKKSFLRDAALISKAQRIEHYEISAYGTLRTFAKELGLKEIANLLQHTLDEEGNADRNLTKIAEGGFFRSGVNEKANEECEECIAPKVKKARPKISKPKTPKIATKKR